MEESLIEKTHRLANEAGDLAERICNLWLNPATRHRYSNETHGRAIGRYKRRVEAVAQLPYERPAWSSVDIYECGSCRHFRALDGNGAGFCCHPVSPSSVGMTGTTYHSLCEQWDGWNQEDA